MAFNAGTGWEVRASAANADGGGGFSGGGSNLATPSAPTTGTATTGGSVAANTYYAVICYLDANGNPGPKSAQTSQVTTGATSTLTVTSPAASAGAVSYAVWWTTTTGGPYWPSPGTAVAIGTNSTRTTTPATTGTQPPGTDYCQQDAAQIAYTDAVVQASTTTAVSVLNPFTPAMVGNVFNVTSGGTVQRAQITAVSASAVATFDKSLGTAAQVCVGNLGGALLTLSAAALLVVAGNGVYAQDGTYGETLTLSVAGSNGTPVSWVGFDVTRGDTPTGTGRPFIDGAATRANCLDLAVSGNAFYNFRFAAATGANVTGASPQPFLLKDCKSSGAGTSGIVLTAGFIGVVQGCELSANTTSGIATSGGSVHQLFIIDSYIHDNLTNGISLASSAGGVVMMNGNIVEANGASGISSASSAVLTAVSRNTIYENTGATSDGLALTGAGVKICTLSNSILSTNGRYGVSRSGATVAAVNGDYNNYFANVTSAYSNVAAGAHDSTAAPQFVDAANGNFAIGTNLKALGWPGLFPGGLSTGYMDIGAVQREEAAAGGGGMLRHPGMVGGTNA